MNPSKYRITDGDYDRSFPVHLVAKEEDPNSGLKLTLHDLGVSWRSPPNFSGYQKFREKVWREFEESHAAQNKTTFDGQLWHVNDVDVKKNAVSVKVKRVRYKDIRATATDQSLRTEVVTDDGREVSIREWLSENQGPLAFPPAANPLVVNTLVVTNDNKIIVSCSNNEVADGVWTSSSSGHVEDLEDLEHSAMRETKEELGLNISRNSFKWLGMIRRHDRNWFALLGIAYLDIHSDAVLEQVASKKNDEVKHVRALDFSRKDIVGFLSKYNCGAVLPVHLDLALESRIRMEDPYNRMEKDWEHLCKRVFKHWHQCGLGHMPHTLLKCIGIKKEVFPKLLNDLSVFCDNYSVSIGNNFPDEFVAYFGKATSKARVSIGLVEKFIGIEDGDKEKWSIQLSKNGRFIRAVLDLYKEGEEGGNVSWGLEILTGDPVDAMVLTYAISKENADEAEETYHLLRSCEGTKPDDIDKLGGRTRRALAELNQLGTLCILRNGPNVICKFDCDAMKYE